MPNCKHCGAPADNKVALMAHYRVCEQSPKNAAGAQVTGDQSPPRVAVIPWNQLPDQARAAAINGHPVRLAVMGRWTPEGVLVDSTDWWRGR